MTVENPKATSGATDAAFAPTSTKGGSSLKKKLAFLLKLGFSAAMLYVIFGKVLAREGGEGLMERVANLEMGWVLAAVGMQLVAIGFSTLRWQRLLLGQGIRASWRFLGGSIMIARFWGAFTPGGFTGFGGWRIYDVAHHTGKISRATVTIGVEMVLGQLAFGAVVMGASIFGVRFIGADGVLLVNMVFLAIMVAGLTFLARPQIFRLLARALPHGVEVRVHSLVDAVCAYQGKAPLLVQAWLFGVGTHAFNNLIYVCAARALGVELGVGEVFFASSLQILATLVPASINGMGLRETAAVALYTSPAIGLPLAVAVLIPTVGFACEMVVSAVGGLIFALRKPDYDPAIEVEDAEREDAYLAAELPVVTPEEQPKIKASIVLGLAAGALGGLLVGLTEGSLVAAGGGFRTGLGVLAYGAVAYAILCTFYGAGVGLVGAWGSRMLRIKDPGAATIYGLIAGFVFASFAFVLGAFRVRRDVFHEELVWKSAKGLGVFLGCGITGALLFALVAGLIAFLVRRSVGAWLLKPWGTPLALVSVVGAVLLASMASAGSGGVVGTEGPSTVAAPEAAGNVLFIVVDTLRADHLPAYGYAEIETPNLDALAAEGVRFDQAFVNASWTRPSFASIMTGRLPSNHGVMAKPAELPDEVTTTAEAMHAAGYTTGGFVTNFNVAPYFNFQQGFDHYQFIEPELILGANDDAAKLLIVQVMRRVVGRFYEDRPGFAYRDAETVNARLLDWIDAAPAARPFFLFAGFMDPHDPYYAHPYDGRGYSRAAHQHPTAEEAPELIRLYDGEIEYWDAQFGRLVAALKERGLYDDLTIIVTADHGEEFHEHGGFWHGTTLYDEQLRVPLLVKLPAGRRGGTVVRHWVQSIDLMPSLLGEVGVEVPEGVQGSSIWEGTDVIYAEESHEGNVLEAIRDRRDLRERKLITANPGNPRGLPTAELFHVDDDPSERDDLAEREPEEVETLRAVLALERERAAVGAAVAEERELGPAEIAQLCRLGYLEGPRCEGL